MLRTKCDKCGVLLFEEDPNRKIFRSFAEKEIDDEKKYFCISCYEHLNDKKFEEVKEDD